MNRPEWTTGPWLVPRLQGAAIGIAVLAILGFSQFGWVTGGTAQKMAKDQSDAAVVKVLTPICVERFQKQPDAEARLTALRNASSSWSQRELLEKTGFATLDGAQYANSSLATACVQGLISR